MLVIHVRRVMNWSMAWRMDECATVVNYHSWICTIFRVAPKAFIESREPRYLLANGHR